MTEEKGRYIMILALFQEFLKGYEDVKMRYVRRITVIIFALSVILYVLTGIKLRMEDDHTVPVITSDREVLQVSVQVTEEELKEGLTASDNKDGDLTENIVVGSISKFVKKGTVNVSYVVFDKNNNAGQFSRKVEFTDYESPEFALSASLDYKVGEVVKVLDRLTVNDSIDGDITDKIRIISSDVDNKQAGVYTIRVQVTNNYGDTAEEDMLINVNNYSPGSPEITLKKYLVYVKKGSSFSPKEYLAGAADTYGDAIDSEEVRIDSEVNTKVTGSYQVTYSVEDGNGNKGYRHLMVIVKE